MTSLRVSVCRIVVRRCLNIVRYCSISLVQLFLSELARPAIHRNFISRVRMYRKIHLILRLLLLSFQSCSCLLSCCCCRRVRIQLSLSPVIARSYIFRSYRWIFEKLNVRRWKIVESYFFLSTSQHDWVCLSSRVARGRRRIYVYRHFVCCFVCCLLRLQVFRSNLSVWLCPR